MDKTIHKCGSLSELGDSYYIVINPENLSLAIKCLRTYVNWKLTQINWQHGPVDFNLHEIPIGEGKTAYAISSSNPHYRFGIPESTHLSRVTRETGLPRVPNLYAAKPITYTNPDGTTSIMRSRFAHVGSVQEIRDNAYVLGLAPRPEAVTTSAASNHLRK